MPGREMTRRELAFAVVGACLLAIVMTWPLVLHLGADVPRDIGDPLAEAWQPAWGGHALLHQPLHFFDANRFWPIKDSLAFGDALIGYAPAGIIGNGPHAALVRYDLLFLFAYALAFFGAYLLARELGLSPAAAVIAGVAFAYAPYRLEQDGHMQVISSGGIPLAIAFAVRGIRLKHPWWLFVAWVVAWWQVSLGFVLGLPFAYGLAGSVVVAGVVWLVRRRPQLDRRLLIAGAAGAVFFVAATYLIAHPYLHIANEFPESKRSTHEVSGFSGPLKVFLTAPEENFIWGQATAGIRNSLMDIPEKTLFPGLAIVALALVGLGSSRLSRRMRIGLGAGTVVLLVLELGFQLEGGLLWPYRVLYDVLPGWNAIRTPGRIATFSTLTLALLAAAGGETLMRAAWRSRLPTWSPVALAGLLALVIVTEGRSLPFDPFDDQKQPPVPSLGTSTADLPQPQLHLPALKAKENRAYQLASTDGFPEIVNGRASTNPHTILTLISDMDSFPDAATVRELQDYGVRTVILHVGLTEGTPQAGAARKSIAGLPLRSYRLPGLVVYEVGSSNASSGPRAGSRAAGTSGPD
ncbi:MAG: hypothetical protein QOD14_122 [Solirubrobacterales bacterium]|nr:hypothetical protein [Solirubrobacterales bacterium]